SNALRIPTSPYFRRVGATILPTNAQVETRVVSPLPVGGLAFPAALRPALPRHLRMVRVKSRTLGVAAALVALPTAAAVLPGRLAGAATTATTPRSRSTWSAQHTSQRTTAKGGTATLVRVTVTTGNDDPSPVGRDAVRRRRTGAGCTNPGSGTGAYTLNGS